MVHQVRSSTMAEESSNYRISRANHKPLGKKSSPPSIPIYHAFQTISSPFSFSRIFVNSILDIDNRILENLTSFLLVGSEIGSTIVSKWNRFEKYFKVFMVGGQSSIPGHGNNFPRNDCVMKAFNTGGVTSSPLEIRTVTLRDIWKQCNFGGLRSTAELMRKLEHNSCSSRGISAIDGRPPKLLARISSLTASRIYAILCPRRLSLAFVEAISSRNERLLFLLVEATSFSVRRSN